MVKEKKQEMHRAGDVMVLIEFTKVWKKGVASPNMQLEIMELAEW